MTAEAAGDLLRRLLGLQVPPVVVCPLLFAVDLRQQVREEGGRLHRDLQPLESVEFGLVYNIVDPF